MAKGRLWQRDIEEQLEQYNAKNDILEAFGERVSAQTLYEAIFPDLDLLMPVIITDEDEEKHVVKMTVQEAIDQAKDRNDMFIGCTSFFNEFLSKATAKNIFCLVIDMDNVYSNILQQIFMSGWRTATGAPMPRPTYVVNSGTGLHLYFIFSKPLPRYRRQAEQIDQLYRRLATVETTSWNYIQKSVQWFGQDFRIAGGNGKNGWENVVYRVGDPWDADKLAAALGLHWKAKDKKTKEEIDFRFKYEDDEETAEQEITTEKRGKKSYFKRRGYALNPRVYESSLERCKKETHEGNRYLSMCALSVLAWKCKIDREKLRADLISLLPVYNEGAERIVKPKEIDSAIKMYNAKALTTPRERSEDWLGWKFVGSRRNGRKQAEHLRRARITQTADYPNGEWRCRNGRLKGHLNIKRKKAMLIAEWRYTHPDGSKADCQRETGISRPTIIKYW